MNRKQLLNLILIVILAIFIFYYSGSYKDKPIVKIEPTNSSDIYKTHKIETGLSYSLTKKQEYITPKVEGFDIVISKILDKLYDYDTICFKDEGSRIYGAPFEDADLTVEIIYAGFGDVVSYTNKGQSIPLGEDDIIVPEDKTNCFKIENRENITWNWVFLSTFNLGDTIIESGEMKQGAISPKVVSYFKVSNNRYINILIFKFVLSIFYAGIFLWGITRVKHFVKEGFK